MSNHLVRGHDEGGPQWEAAAGAQKTLGKLKTAVQAHTEMGDARTGEDENRGYFQSRNHRQSVNTQQSTKQCEAKVVVCWEVLAAGSEA